MRVKKEEDDISSDNFDPEEDEFDTLELDDDSF